MTEVLATLCDHCGAKLKLKNPALAGKKIKCPKCGEAFVVVELSEDEPPRSASRKKPATDDDLGFMDLDSDDYGSKSSDDEDEELFDSPRPRKSRSRGGSGKPKKKKSKGNSASVMPMLIIFVAAALVLGGGAYGLTLLLQGDGSSDVDWLPSDVQGYVKVQVDGLWNAPVFQGLKGTPGGQKLVAEMTKAMSLGPQDIDQLTVGIGPSRADAVIVVKGRKPFDHSAIQAAEKLNQASHNGVSFLTNGREASYLPNPTTLVHGTEAQVKSLIERGRKNPNADKFAFARGYRDHLVIVTTGNASPMPSTFIPRGTGSQTGLIRANATSDIRASVQEVYGSADAAKTQTDKMKADLDKGKSEFARMKSQMAAMPANPLVKPEQLTRLMTGAEQVMNSVQVSQSGAQVRVQVAVPGQLITDFVEFSSSAAGGAMPRLLPF